jgi:hypothetical protein
MSQTPDHYAVTDIGVLRFQIIMQLRLWKRAQIPDHYALTDIGVFRLQTNHALMAMEGLGLYTIMQFTGVGH